ncbi:hypothetical protein DFJ77DRAFT_506388 [Powellomyces hirtus]|nr:hypothetical protein DFJ77DRAFT_506388 [Powellomyces hirtus]
MASRVGSIPPWKWMLVVIYLCGIAANAVVAKTTVRAYMIRGIPVKPEDPSAEEWVMNPLLAQFEAQTGIELQVDYSSTVDGSKHAANVKSYLEKKLPDYDLFMLDVVWPADFFMHLADLSQYLTPAQYGIHNENILKADWVEGRLVALPYWTDYGLLYYRQDLLTKYGYAGPPKTWDELEEMALKIVPAEKAINKGFTGYVGQYNSYEGLTCNIVEWLNSVGGGNVVDAEKQVNVDNPEARAMLQRVHDWVHKKGITLFDGLFYQEDHAQKKWMDRETLFMRNWPHVGVAAKKVPDFPPFGMTRLPGRTADMSGGALGGWHIGLSKYSTNLTAGALALNFLSGAVVQKQRAMNYSLVPTIPALYNDPAICQAIDCPLMASIIPVARPTAASSPNYLAVSRALYTNMNNYLANTIDLETALAKVKFEAESAMGSWRAPDLGPPVYVGWSSGLGAAMVALTVLSLMYALSLLFYVIAKRGVKVIRAASPTFCALMILGNMMNLATIFVYTGEPSKTTCILQPWILGLSFSTAMAAMIFKTWRIYRIFNNRLCRSLTIKDSQLFINVGVVVGIEVILLIIWTAVDAPEPAMIELATSRFWSCKSPSEKVHKTMTGVLFSFNGLLALSGVFMAYMTRNVRGEYNESKYIGLCIYNVFVLSVLAIPLMYVSDLGPNMIYVVRSVVILIINVVMLSLFFIPKLKAINEKGSDNSASRTGGQGSLDYGGQKGSQNAAAALLSKQVTEAQVKMVSGQVYVRQAKYKWALNAAQWKRVIMHYLVTPELLIVNVQGNNGAQHISNTYSTANWAVIDHKSDVESKQHLITVTGLNQSEIFEFQFETESSFNRWHHLMTAAQATEISKKGDGSIGANQLSPTGTANIMGSAPLV